MKLPQEKLHDFINSILIKFRLKYLPLMWDEAKYHDDTIDLYFSVFDPYKHFDSNTSILKINDQNHPFDYVVTEEFVRLAFQLKKRDFSTFWAKVDFQFYPNQLIHEWQQSWFIPLSEDRTILPNAERLLRVIGDYRTSSYQVGGADNATKLSWVLEKQLKLSLDSIKVLDWGCGCGRVTQFLKHRGIVNLFAADIDEDNVKWCTENIQGISFSSIPYYPPTQFPDNYFDAVIGISVMTHLTEDTHKAWLEEIKRILRPGGIALLSIRGLIYYHLVNEPIEFVAEVEERGYIDRHRDSALDAITREQEYYRASYFSHDYINTVWGQYFQILDIIEGLVLQDVIVLRKPNI